jgi:hypothetical protein
VLLLADDWSLFDAGSLQAKRLEKLIQASQGLGFIGLPWLAYFGVGLHFIDAAESAQRRR